MQKEKIGFILFENLHNKPNTASSRYQGHWLMKYWPEAEVYRYGQKYDAIIFQKAYLPEYMKLYDGVKILSICDPDWINGVEIKRISEYIDGIVCPTEEIAKFLRQLTDKPVKVIPDRIDLNFYKERKIHKGKAKEAVWHGYSQNHYTIKAAKGALYRLGLRLSVISDSSFTLNSDSDSEKIDERYTKWNSDNFGREFIKSDICILPGSTNPLHKYKSNNKTTLAWSLGLPVATNVEELTRFMDESERIKEQKLRYKEVKEKYDVKLSVKEYQEFISELKKEKI